MMKSVLHNNFTSTKAKKWNIENLFFVTYLVLIFLKISGLNEYIYNHFKGKNYTDSHFIHTSTHPHIHTSIDQKFEQMKFQVVQYNANSWCSKAKTELIMNLVFKNKPQICVEIGAFTGSSILPVAVTLKHLKKGIIYAIDAWSNEIVTKEMPETDPNYQWWKTLDMKNIKSQFETLIQSWGLNDYCNVIQASSEDASQLIPLIDFLHLDSGFSENAATRDVELYLPKVKTGGYILISTPFMVVDRDIIKLNSIFRILDECDLVFQLDEDFALFRKR